MIKYLKLKINYILTQKMYIYADFSYKTLQNRLILYTNILNISDICKYNKRKF